MAKTKAQKEAEAAAKKAEAAAKKLKGSAAVKVIAFTLPDHATNEDKKHADSAASGVHREC